MTSVGRDLQSFLHRTVSCDQRRDTFRHRRMIRGNAFELRDFLSHHPKCILRLSAGATYTLPCRNHARGKSHSFFGFGAIHGLKGELRPVSSQVLGAH